MNNKDKKKVFTIFIIIIAGFLLSFLNPLKLFAEDNKLWIDTSHWELQDVFIPGGYWVETEKKSWIDTSYKVSRGNMIFESYQSWVDTSHYERSGYYKTETYAQWISSGYYKTENINVWVNSGYTQNVWINSGYYVNRPYNVWVNSGYWQTRIYQVWDIKEEPGWGINRGFPVITSAGYAYLRTVVERIWINTSHWETRYNNVYVDTSHWQTSYINTSHWENRSTTIFVDTSHWEQKEKSVWVDTSRWVTEGHYETKTGLHWVDTSYTVNQGYWQYYTSYNWIDTGHFEVARTWVPSGYWAELMHGIVEVEKDPEYVLTKWHCDDYGNECSMSMKISWKIDNTGFQENEKKKINRIYIYEDLVRYGNNEVEKIEIINLRLNPSEIGAIETQTKFEHSGNEESIIHIYVYSETGETGHVCFKNPVNGFRSINLGVKSSNQNSQIWLGGIKNEIFEF